MIGPNTVVADASIAISIARREPEGRAAMAAIAGWLRGGAQIVVPSHFWLEVTTSLARRHHWRGSQVLEAVHELDRLRFETVALDRALVVLAIDVSERHGLSTYDAAYLALAETLDASLATFDRALGLAAGARALRPGAPRLSEAPSPYEHHVTWPSYRGASAYLAKLRAEAARPT